MLFVVSLALVIASLAGLRWLRRQTASRGAAAPLLGVAPGLVALVFAITALSQCIVVIPAGSVGVVVLFGRVTPAALEAGLHLRNPFAEVVRMSIQTQEQKETLDVPSKEGLTMQLEISVIYHLDPKQAATVYREIGVDYVRKVLEPEFRSVSRGVTAGYDAKALYTSEREQLALLITGDLRKQLDPRGVIVEITPLRRLGLPARLAAAIEEKLGAEQESQRMQFVLTKEKQEAERKRIEAQGIADFQKIVTLGISEPLLKWKGIEATEKLAASANTKVVIIGGKDGLPVILGNQ